MPPVQVRVIENAVLSELSHRHTASLFSETDIDVRALEIARATPEGARCGCNPHTSPTVGSGPPG